MAGGGGESSEYEVNINLTALLDVLTNLLFFLMLGMGAQASNMELDGGVTLPNSTSESQPVKTLQVTIGQRDLRVDKEPIAQLKGGQVVGAPAGRISALYNQLMKVKGEKHGKELDVSDVLIILCDKDTPYGLLKQVLNTSAEAGFPKFRMAVLMQ